MAEFRRNERRRPRSTLGATGPPDQAVKRGLALYFFLVRWPPAGGPAPAVNLGALDALILTVSPVCGLRPVRALRLATENLPKPVRAISSPFLRVFSTVEMNASTDLRASALVRPLSLAMASTSSVLFMRLLLNRRQTEGAA